MTHKKMTPFQRWLSAELDSRDWSHAKLGREIDVFKGTVGRWLMPPDHPMHRQPSYESCRRLADLFGVDLHFILEAAGIDNFERDRNLTDLQRDTIALVKLLPDSALAPLYPMIRALLDERVQATIERTAQAQARARGDLDAKKADDESEAADTADSLDKVKVS
ncbi:hypothetical protein [Microbacterium sp.]|uniref:hypothetical protein n=1 Tax=Microbacterium sp. TaxID=51671 RepID=UPI002625C7C5|nr:hypothetical protein [Microbacterium sp.]